MRKVGAKKSGEAKAQREGSHSQRRQAYVTQRRITIWKTPKGTEEGTRERDMAKFLPR